MNDLSYAPPYSAFRHEMFGQHGDRYFADDGLLAAANAALALERPLLLTGEPGCGKTDFAFAAASGLSGDASRADYRPLEFYVRSDTTASDLLYRYDAVRRFSDAQTEAEKLRARLPQNYVTLESLGEALVSPERRVVLIDEIDKAQRDLPNDLLRELDQGDFNIAEIDPRSDQMHAEADQGHRHLRRNMSRPAGVPRPLVIITSNVERQLPDAFLRRCLFYYVPFPDADRLIDILDARLGKNATARHRTLVFLFEALRKERALTKRPATAELIDWAGCLRQIFQPNGVDAALEAEAQRLDKSGTVQWRNLPGISCLVKLREDMVVLDLGGRESMPEA